MKNSVKVCCILIINIVSMHFLDAQSPVYFTKTFDTGEAKSMIEVSDSIHGTCYVIAGRVGDVGADGFLMKFNVYGDTLWTRWYGSPAYEIINAVKQTPDEGFILVGKSESSLANGVSSALVIKTDASGNAEWSRSYQGTGSGVSYLNGIELFDVEIVNDGYVIVGSSRAFQDSSQPPGSFAMWVAKISLGGQFMWSKTYSNSRAGISIKKTSDGGFVIAQDHVQGNMALTKIDSIGNTIWNKTYGGPDQDFANEMISTSTGYLIVGRTLSFGAQGYGSIYVVKTDFNGDHQWSRKVGDQSYAMAFGAMEDSDRGFVVAGACYGKFLFLKIDSIGNLLWASELGNNQTSNNRANQILSAPGGYFIAGQLDNYLSLVRIDTLGNPACHGYSVPVVSTFVPTQTISITGSDSLVTPLITFPNLGVYSGSTIATICALYPSGPQHKSLKIINILSPATPQPAGTTLYPSFRVKNYGTDTITTFDFFYFYYNNAFGMPPVSSTLETWSGVLLPNQQLDIIMNESLMVYFGIGEFCIHVMVTGTTIAGNDTLCYDVLGFTNIDEAGKETDDFRLFPNPSTGEITSTEEGKLIFFNLAGKQVYEQEVRSNEKITLSLPAGVYIYTINHKKGKLIVL